MNKINKKIRILDLFSGAGGFSKGFVDAGYMFEKHYFSEIDRHAIANFKHNFKNAEYIGDIRSVDGKKYRGIDVITFGSPCQDFSLAGKRRGLRGDRSSLLREAIRIVEEARPRVFIWENVKGTFSSNSRRDFWSILKAFTNIGGYRFEWQLLNTKWILPQNRERIYFVGILTTNKECKRRVFPLQKDDFLHFGKRRVCKTKFQTQNYSSTINPKFGERRIDTFIAVGDFRYDVGFRFRKNNLSPNLTSNPWAVPILKIKNKTKQGYKMATVGDTIGYNYIRSVKRGRVGEGVCQTLDTGCKVATLLSNYRIRRLTEIECERLQGFPCNWTKYGNYDGEIKEISRTQRYRLIGNAVTSTIVCCIAEKIKPFLL